MLRVGLTGGLGSGKSTVAGYLRELGAQVIEADELGRALMKPGHQVYDQIVRGFGPEVVSTDGTLNRPRIAELAFQGGRLNQLNAIVHPAVIAAQRVWMESIFAGNPAAVAVIESALIFVVERDARARGAASTASSSSPRLTSSKSPATPHASPHPARPASPPKQTPVSAWPIRSLTRKKQPVPTISSKIREIEPASTPRSPRSGRA